MSGAGIGCFPRTQLTNSETQRPLIDSSCASDSPLDRAGIYNDFNRERERRTDRQKEREIQRETERERDRKKDIHTETMSERWRERDSERERRRERDGERETVKCGCGAEVVLVLERVFFPFSAAVFFTLVCGAEECGDLTLIPSPYWQLSKNLFLGNKAVKKNLHSSAWLMFKPSVSSFRPHTRTHQDENKQCLLITTRKLKQNIQTIKRVFSGKENPNHAIGKKAVLVFCCSSECCTAQ